MAGRAGRADLSTNWRVKSDLPASSPTGPNRGWGQTQENRESPQQNTPSKYTKDDQLAIRALEEGRRLYVGNMNYMAKREDVEELFKDLESAMQVQIHLIRAHAND